MSSYQAARSEHQAHLWTLEGLSADLGFSTYQIRKYIENGHVPRALGKHPNGFNYNHRHYHALSTIRAERDALRLLSQNVRVRHPGRPHCVVPPRPGLRMTVTGRTTPRWGRDRSARWDPGETNRWRSYPARPDGTMPPLDLASIASVVGRPGAAERELVVSSTPAGHTPLTVSVALTGWYTDEITLNERQARRLLEILSDHVRLHDDLQAECSPETTD